MEKKSCVVAWCRNERKCHKCKWLIVYLFRMRVHSSIKYNNSSVNSYLLTKILPETAPWVTTPVTLIVSWVLPSILASTASTRKDLFTIPRCLFWQERPRSFRELDLNQTTTKRKKKVINFHWPPCYICLSAIEFCEFVFPSRLPTLSLIYLYFLQPTL